MLSVAEKLVLSGNTKELALDHIKVERVKDSKETGRKLRYQIAEIVIYFVWPLLIMWLLIWVGLPITWAGIIGSIVFAWPALKGFYGRLRSKKGEDPRPKIRSSSFWFDGFLFWGSPVLREIRMYSALSRSLDVIYNIFGRFGIEPKNFSDGWENEISPFNFVNKTVKAWTMFWNGMPVAQDVRSRPDIIAEEYKKEIIDLAGENPGRVINIVEIAGGSLQGVIMGIRRALDQGAIFYYKVVSIEPEVLFAKPRALELIKQFKLKEECFEFIVSRISTKKEKPELHIQNILKSTNHEISKFDFLVCVGLGDYYYTPKRIKSLLQHLNVACKVMTANITDNFIEHFFLHVLIQWPKMKYRSLREWAELLVSVFGEERRIRIVQTPLGIFNIAMIEKK
ncbi:MAG: hypothetical protein ABIG60_04055 [Patescibacteria group bacterium]